MMDNVDLTDEQREQLKNALLACADLATTIWQYIEGEAQTVTLANATGRTYRAVEALANVVPELPDRQEEE